MTGPGLEHGDHFAAAFPCLSGTNECRSVNSTSTRDRSLENACESGDVDLVKRLLAEGANPNFTVSSGIQPGKAVVNSPQVGVKRLLDSGEDLRRRSSGLNKLKPINFQLTQYTLEESHQVDGKSSHIIFPRPMRKL